MKIDRGRVRAGYELASVTKRVEFEKMKVFSAWSGISDHTSDEEARAVGLPKAMAQGLMSYMYLTEIMVRSFGQDWLRGGKMNVAFLKPVLRGSVITARAAVRSTETLDSGLKVDLDVSCVNQDGELTAAGSAMVELH